MKICQELIDLASAANGNCEQLIDYLSLYRPQLAEEFRVFVKNIDQRLNEIGTKLSEQE